MEWRQIGKGNGKCVDIDGGRRERRARSPVTPGRRVRITGLLGVLLLCWGMAHAQSAQYTYDAHGRVVATTQANGTSAAYTYDALGNVVQVGAVPAGQLAIFALVPSHGEAGTQVTIAGQGFGSNAANDTVSFNGTVATVLSATATQLTVSVPGGATTGSVGVTVGSQTATSPMPFGL